MHPLEGSVVGLDAMVVQAHLYQHKMFHSMASQEWTAEQWRGGLLALPVLWPSGVLDPWAIHEGAPVWQTVTSCWAQRKWLPSVPGEDGPWLSNDDRTSLMQAWVGRISEEHQRVLPIWEWPIAALWHGVVPTPEVIKGLLPACSLELIRALWEVIPNRQEPGVLGMLAHHALRTTRDDVLGWALAEGASPNAIGANGATLLHAAHTPEQVVLLKNAGASWEQVDAEGRNAPEAWVQAALSSSEEYGRRAGLAVGLLKALSPPENTPAQMANLIFCMAIQKQLSLGDLGGSGLGAVLEQEPVATWRDASGNSWGLLGHIARHAALRASGVSGETGELLSKILCTRPSAARQRLWLHNSISGLPDLLLALVVMGRSGTADRPVAERLATRVSQAIDVVYADAASWSAALIPTLAVLRQRRNPEDGQPAADAPADPAGSLTMPWHLLVRPDNPFRRLSGPSFGPKEWWRTLSPADTRACAVDIGLWLTENNRRQEIGVQNALCAHWNTLETTQPSALQDWAPALLGMCHRPHLRLKPTNTSEWRVWEEDDLRTRMERWTQFGVDWKAALEVLQPAVKAAGHLQFAQWVAPYVIHGSLSDILSPSPQEIRKPRM